jgi:hypothetical protein
MLISFMGCYFTWMQTMSVFSRYLLPAASGFKCVEWESCCVNTRSYFQKTVGRGLVGSPRKADCENCNAGSFNHHRAHVITHKQSKQRLTHIPKWPPIYALTRHKVASPCNCSLKILLLHGLSPRANYTDRATAACQRSDCQLLRIEGATWSA